jgi:hypothetical protein
MILLLALSINFSFLCANLRVFVNKTSDLFLLDWSLPSPKNIDDVLLFLVEYFYDCVGELLPAGVLVRVRLTLLVNAVGRPKPNGNL